MKKLGEFLNRNAFVALSSAVILSASALAGAGFVFAQNIDLQNKISSLSDIGSVCGPAGQDGADGATGPCGPAGATGPCGPQGPEGDAGAQGEAGSQGETGAQGQQGESGAPGSSGSQGAKGETGATGAQGEKGEKGETGATGATGAQGEKGEKGETGASGATGTAGRDGVDGITTLGYHGAFYDTSDQTLVAGTTGQAMRLNTSDPTNCGVYVPTETSSRIYVSNAGIYNLQFSAQLRSDSNQTKPVDIWLSKNGQSVEYTNTQFFAPDRKGIYIAAWNFLVPMNAGDYVELMWYSTDSTVHISQLPAQTNPPIPAVPSLIATLTQVG